MAVSASTFTPNSASTRAWTRSRRWSSEPNCAGSQTGTSGRQAADRYHELLAGLDDVILPRTAPDNVHVWHLYVLQVPRRDHVLRVLQELGIQAAIHYPVPLHLLPAFRRYGYGPGDFPIAEAAAARIVSLPLYPHITPCQQRVVADALRRAL